MKIFSIYVLPDTKKSLSYYKVASIPQGFFVWFWWFALFFFLNERKKKNTLVFNLHPNFKCVCKCQSPILKKV